MANYEGYARSSYFKVKDPDAFKQLCRRWNLTAIEKEFPEHGLLHGFMEEDGNGLPDDRISDAYIDEVLPLEDQEEALRRNDEADYDFLGELAEHLEPGWVAVLEEVGHEKLRYLNAYTRAVNSKGETRELGMAQAFQPLTAELGEFVTEALY